MGAGGYDGLRFLVNMFIGTPIRKILWAAGGQRPYRWTSGDQSTLGSLGDLPSWATLDEETGEITGTPNSLVTTDAILHATGADGRSITFNVRFQDGS